MSIYKNYSKIIIDVNLILNYLNYSIIIEIKKKIKYLTLILMILFQNEKDLDSGKVNNIKSQYMEKLTIDKQ